MGGATLTIVFALIRREFLISLRQRWDILNIFLFFVVTSSLFVIATSAEKSVLLELGPSAIWVSALLASYMGLGRLFFRDAIDGVIDQLVISGELLTVLVFSKVFAHWVVTGFPVVLLAPILGVQFGLPKDAIVILSLSLLLGTPALSLIGCVAASLTIGVRTANALTAILTLPLYVPVLVFGTSAVANSNKGLSSSNELAILGAILLLMIVFSCWASSAAIRISAEE